MKVLSLFDGISVAQQALKELGIECEYYASEIDKYAISITTKNFPNTIQLGDVKGLATELENIDRKWSDNIDLLIGGSPCQDLSIAKKNREGLKGARSGLFYEYVRILKEVKPKYFVLENVNSMPKEAKEQITEIMGVEPIMINAALVSAQNRKRLFWTNIPNVTQPEDRGILLKDILQPPAQVDERMVMNGKAFSVTASYNGAVAWNSIERKQRTMVRVRQFGKDGQGDRIYSPDGKSVGLSALGGGCGAKTGLYAIAPNGKQIILGDEPLQVLKEGRTELGKKSRQEIRKQTGKDSTFRSKEHKAYFGRDGVKASCITTGIGVEGMVVEDFIIRKLTPIECERLQSLPDGFSEGVSNTQRYKALGNAFNCEVIKHIIKNILPPPIKSDVR